MKQKGHFNVSNQPDFEKSVIVIGAGMSGLMAAHLLQKHGFKVTVLDKGKGVGGRLATRRMDDAILDHGAQFFTARNPRFLAFVSQWQAQGLIQIWPGLQDGQEPRYIAQQGMTAIAKALAQPLQVLCNTLVERIDLQDQGWKITDANQQTYQSRFLILTAPLPQIEALLQRSDFQWPAGLQAELRPLDYHPCLALLVTLNKPSGIPKPGFLEFQEGPLRWMADNQRKGISPNNPSVTIHAAPELSRSHFDVDETFVAQQLLEAAKPWVPDAIIQNWQLKKWRYSQPVQTDVKLFRIAHTDPVLLLAGDAFGGPRVEGAALSGLAAADYLCVNFSN